MTKSLTEFGQDLRQRAEEFCRLEYVTDLKKLSPEETEHLFHELRVHQIELEVQNEELQRIQRELGASQARYFDLYDLAPVGYLTLNSQRRISEVNLTAANLLGSKRAALLDTAITSLILPEDQDVYYLHHKKVVACGEVQACELRMLHTDGSSFWVRLQSSLTAEGECWITLNDISESKRAEAERLEFERRCQQAQRLESLGVLVGGIAHDFNNILAIIIGNCSLAKLRPATAAEYLPPIEIAADRAAELCRQMLAYAGKSHIVMTQVYMALLVRETVKLLNSTLPQNVTITATLADDIPYFKGDSSQIRQIVMNLILNAAEAIGQAQGEVRVSLARATIRAGQADKDYLGTAIAPGWYVCLEVADNGCGMDDETRQRIFEPFFTTKFTGRGLGLSATLGIITKHGGALQLFSRPGSGSTFRVYLPQPIAEPIDAVVSDQAETPDARLGNRRALLVEDEVSIRRVTVEMLKALGFAVVEAADGREALDLYQANPADIDLVITDIGMPVMDGYETFQRLKELDPDLPIIVSSGFADVDVASRIPVEEIAGSLRKPYNFDQLRDVLNNLMEKSPAQPS